METTGSSSAEWPVSWQAARRARLEASAAATVEQRLAWLEAALEVAAASGALERRRRASAAYWETEAHDRAR